MKDTSPSLWLPVAPRPWQRTRGHDGYGRFTAPEHRAYTEEIGYRLRHYFYRPQEGPVSVDVTFTPEGIRFRIAEGPPRPPVMRGDLDNYAKAILDAAQGIAFRNDRQVTDLHARLGEEE